MRFIALFLTVLTLFAAVGCGHTQHMDTGIPASSADNFYFNMQQVARQKGYSTRVGERENRDLSITTNIGSLKYGLQTNQPGVRATVYVDEIEGESKSATNARLDALWAIHYELIKEARALAERNDAFKP